MAQKTLQAKLVISSNRTRELFSSPVFIFLYYSLIFGGLIQLVNGGPFYWERLIIPGMPLGLIMAVITLRQNKRHKEETGLDDQEQIRALHAAIKTGTLPHDPEVRKVLPGYLPKRLIAYQKVIKHTVPLLLVIAAANLLVLLASRNAALIILEVVFIGLIIITYRSARNAIGNITVLAEQLNIGDSLKAVDSKPKRSVSFKKIILIAAICLLLLILLAWYGNSGASTSP